MELNAPQGDESQRLPDHSWQRWTIGRLRWHAVALLVLLIALIPALDSGTAALPDEGLYTAQAENLSNGSWSAERPAVDVDRDGRWVALVDAVPEGSRSIPYYRRPLFPLIATPFWWMGRYSTAFLLTVMGTWIAACSSTLAAKRLDPRAGVPTLWLLGVGSPLLFDAYLVVGHSLAAAFAGVAVLGIAMSVGSKGPRSRFSTWGWPVLALLSVALLTLVRTEGAIVATALAISVVVTSVHRRNRRFAFEWSRVGLGIAIALTTAATFLINDAWARTIGGSSTVSAAAANRHPNPINSLWTSVIRPWYPDNRSASVAMGLALLCFLLGAVALRLSSKSQLLGIVLLAVGAGATVVRATQEPSLISGLIAASPWILVGLLSLRLSVLRTSIGAILAITTLLSMVAILFTSYGEGGAAEWGGRFFHVVLPVVAPLAVCGILALITDLPPTRAMICAGAIGLSAIALGTSALRANATLRDATRTFQDVVVDRYRSEQADLAVLVRPSYTGTSRLLWTLSDEGVELVNAPGLASLPRLLSDVSPNRDRVMLLTDVPGPLLASLFDRSNSRWSVTDVIEPGDNLFYIVVLDRDR